MIDHPRKSRFLAAWVLACLLGPSPDARAQAEAGPRRKVFVFLVGVGKNAADERLPYAVSDVQRLAAHFERMWPDDTRVRSLTDDLPPSHRYYATRDNIRRELGKFVGDLAKGDLLIVVLNGHGSSDGQNNYFVPAEPAKGKLLISELYQLIDGCDAEDKLVLINSCRLSGDKPVVADPVHDPNAGIIQRDSLEERDRRQGTSMYEEIKRFKKIFSIVSCAEGQASMMDPKGDVGGVFMFYCLQAFQGYATCQSPGDVTTPQVREFTSGDLVQHLEEGVPRHIERMRKEGRLRDYDGQQQPRTVAIDTRTIHFGWLRPRGTERFRKVDFRVDANWENLQRYVRGGGTLRYADFTGSIFESRDFSELDRDGPDMRGAIFDGAWLQQAHLDDAKLHMAQFREAHMWGATMVGVHAIKADFTGADLRNTDWEGADASGAVFAKARIEGWKR